MRGQAEMLDWFPRLIMMTVAIIIIVVLVRVYTDRDVNVPELQRGTYLYRLYYSPIIMYQDTTTTRVYPGIVDATKFTSKILDDVFAEKEKPEDTSKTSKISAMLELTPQKDCSISIAENPIYNDKATFGAYLQFAKLGVPQDGSATMEVASYPVTLRSGNTDCRATLNITIVRPNS